MALTIRSELHRLASGWITAAAIDANSAYLITNFTVDSTMQQDNQTVVEWLAPVNTSQLPRRAAYDRMISGRKRGQGFVSFTLNFSYFTFSMLAVFYGYYTDRDKSTQMTVKLYDQRDAARYYQCYMEPFNEWSPTAEPIQGGWRNVVVPFSGGTEIS